MNGFLSAQLNYVQNYSKLINLESTYSLFIHNGIKKNETSKNINNNELLDINSETTLHNHLFIIPKLKTLFVTNNQLRMYSKINGKLNGKLNDKSANKSNDKSNDKLNSKSNNKLNDKSNDKSNELEIHVFEVIFNGLIFISGIFIFLYLILLSFFNYNFLYKWIGFLHRAWKMLQEM